MRIRRLLIVDEDPQRRAALLAAAAGLGLELEEAPGARAALAHLAHAACDLALIAGRLASLEGPELVERLAELHPGLATALVVEPHELAIGRRGLELGALDCLLRPVTPPDLALVVERATRALRLRGENDALRHELQGDGDPRLVARSLSTVEAVRTATRVARSRGGVLITGERGTGRTRLALQVHRRSPRRRGPFVRLLCAGPAGDELLGELLGRTGSAPDRVARAQGGTLLVEEIGAASEALQARLAEIFSGTAEEEAGEGGRAAPDVRLVGTSRRSPEELLVGGQVRGDLLERFGVFHVHLAPLRERRKDVRPLAEHFAEVHARRIGRSAPKLSPEAVHALEAWRWPGNLHELEGVIQRAVARLEDDEIGMGQLVSGPLVPSPSPARAGGDSERELGRLLADLPVAHVERLTILATLDRTGGNKTEAARRLGLTARTLSNKLKLWRSEGLMVRESGSSPPHSRAGS